MTISQKVGYNIKTARKWQGLTQSQMAKLLAMTQQQYSRFENGVFELNYEQIIKICHILHMAPNEMFDIDNPTESCVWICFKKRVVKKLLKIVKVKYSIKKLHFFEHC